MDTMIKTLIQLCIYFFFLNISFTLPLPIDHNPPKVNENITLIKTTLANENTTIVKEKLRNESKLVSSSPEKPLNKIISNNSLSTAVVSDTNNYVLKSTSSDNLNQIKQQAVANVNKFVSSSNDQNKSKLALPTSDVDIEQGQTPASNITKNISLVQVLPGNSVINSKVTDSIHDIKNKTPKDSLPSSSKPSVVEPNKDQDETIKLQNQNLIPKEIISQKVSTADSTTYSQSTLKFPSNQEIKEKNDKITHLDENIKLDNQPKDPLEYPKDEDGKILEQNGKNYDYKVNLQNYDNFGNDQREDYNNIHKEVSNPHTQIFSNKNGEIYDDANSHFFAYFLTMMVMVVLFYLLFHNKQRIIALMIEGRGSRPSRRGNRAKYHKLDNNLEETMSSTRGENMGIDGIY